MTVIGTAEEYAVDVISDLWGKGEEVRPRRGCCTGGAERLHGDRDWS